MCVGGGLEGGKLVALEGALLHYVGVFGALQGVSIIGFIGFYQVVFFFLLFRAAPAAYGSS